MCKIQPNWLTSRTFDEPNVKNTPSAMANKKPIHRKTCTGLLESSDIA